MMSQCIMRGQGARATLFVEFGANMTEKNPGSYVLHIFTRTMRRPCSGSEIHKIRRDIVRYGEIRPKSTKSSKKCMKKMRARMCCRHIFAIFTTRSVVDPAAGLKCIRYGEIRRDTARHGRKAQEKAKKYMK